MKQRSLWALSGALFLGFAVLAAAVKTSAGLQSWDFQAALWANHLNLGDAGNWLLVNASLYGREYFWIPLVGLLLLFGDKRTKLVGLGLAGVFVVGIVAGEVAKEVVARSRPFTLSGTLSLQTPYVLRIPIETDYSYPSGHALIVSIGALYSLLTFSRRWVSALLAVEAAAVCFSRVYTFEHFPTDVFGGIALGGAIAIAGFAAGRTPLRREADRVVGYLVKVLRDGPLRV